MNVDVGHRIRIRRTVLRMTQGELADTLGISQNHLSNMENGNRTISTEMLDRIAEVLQCRPEDLLNEKRRLA